MTRKSRGFKIFVLLLVGYFLFSVVTAFTIHNKKIYYEKKMLDMIGNEERYKVSNENIVQTIYDCPKTSIGIAVLMSRTETDTDGNVYLDLLDASDNYRRVASRVISIEELTINPQYIQLICNEGFLNTCNEYDLSIHCDETIDGLVCCYVTDNSSCSYTLLKTIDGKKIMLNMLFLMKKHSAIIYLWILCSVGIIFGLFIYLAKIKQGLRDWIYRIVGMLVRLYYSFSNVDKFCVVNIEGGLASQLEQYTLGQLLKSKGYDVRYDISFYKNGKGTDVLGKNARNLDIQKLDRNIDISTLDAKTLNLYQKFFRYSEKYEKCQMLRSNSIIKPPIYLGGYGYGCFSEAEFEVIYKNSIQIDFDIEVFGSENTRMLDAIKSNDNSIALHVRRGDTLLAKVGRPIAKKEYYLEALRLCDNDATVYIFGDDFDWIEDELIPSIPNNERCILVKINGADRGWCDLILMAACHTQIKSPAGGLGREAFRLNGNKDARLIMPVYVSGNMCSMSGNITEIILNDELCDMQYVKNKNDRL